MKRRILAITAALLLFGGIVSADGLNGSYNGNPIVLVKSNGQTLSGDVPAQLQGDYTMVPLGLLRKLGITVDWDQRSYTADVKLPKQHANVLSQAELDSLSRNVGIVYAIDKDGYPIHQGSGFVIDGGTFVTNAHVMDGAVSMKATINGKDYTATNPVFNDTKMDLYGVNIGGTTTLRISKTLPEKGDKVYSIGYSGGKISVNVGSVVSINNTQGKTVIENTTQTEKGQSGGLLANEYGEVVGITSFNYKITGTDGSISIQHVVEALK